MTVYGLFNDGADVLNANMLRQVVALLTEGGPQAGGFATHGLSITGGVRITGGYIDALKVNPGVSGLTVAVNTGIAAIPGATTGSGGYILVNDAVKTVTLATADGSQARIDRIIATVTDTGAADSVYDIVPVTGTPAGSPAAPALPSNAVSLATVLVAAGANSPAGLTVTDTRTQLNQPMRPYVGFSMGREEIPAANTTSSSFVTLWYSAFRRRAASVAAHYLVHTPSGSTGEIRLVVNEIPVQTLSVGSGTFAYGSLSGAIPASIAWNDLAVVKLHVRLVSGTGPIGLNFTNGYTF